MTERPSLAGAAVTFDETSGSGSYETLLQNGLARNSLRLIRVRWAAGAFVLLATAFCVRILRLPLPGDLLYISGATILAYNVPLAWLAKRAHRSGRAGQERQFQWMLNLQALLDWLSLTMLVHLTGGITSPLILFFLLLMLTVTILQPDQSPYPFVALGPGALALIAVLELTGGWPHYPIIPGLPAELYRDPVYFGVQILFFSVVAVASVYLAANMTRELHKREHQVTALLRTAQTVSSTLELQKVMEYLARSAAEALSAPSASIRLLDESGERLHLAAAYGLSRHYLDKGDVELSRSPLDQEALLGHRTIVRDVATDSRLQYPTEILGEGIRSLLAVPIIGRGRALGVLRVYSQERDRFTDNDAVFAVAIAQQGATALQNAMAHDALHRADLERAEFVRSVTHELRAPVSTAQSLLHTLLGGMAGELTDRQRDILGRIARRFCTLADLINDLLALAQSKTAVQFETPGPVMLQSILEQIVEQWGVTAAEKRVDLLLNAPEEPMAVCATPEDLARIFDNLVGNAVKYTKPDGTVKVTMSESPGGVLITVEDNGIGIPEDDLPKLWDEFFRARNTRTTNITGTGLGLSIVKRLLERYRGMVSVQSVEGEGTTFSVRFPLIVAEPRP